MNNMERRRDNYPRNNGMTARLCASRMCHRCATGRIMGSATCELNLGSAGKSPSHNLQILSYRKYFRISSPTSAPLTTAALIGI
jgi:hypothetical protein